jgi:Ras-related protein Rab-1A
MDQDYDYLFKIIIIGDSSVGKSSIVSKFVDDKYNENFMSTIGVDLNVKMFEVDDKKVKMQIWEIGGNEIFRNIVSCYYKNCQGILLTFDVTNKESFENVQNWLSHIKENGNESTNDIPKIIIGNKNDLEKMRKVSYEEAYDFSSDLNISYIETSVKNGDKINDVFFQMAREIKMNRKYCLKNMKSFEVKVPRVKEERSCCFCNWFACCF